MKKICFVTTVSITVKSFLLDYGRYLSQNGYEVTFICDTDESLHGEMSENMRYIPVKMKRGISLDGFKVIKTLKKIFKEEGFDIVQYSTPNASLYASIAAKKAKVKNRLYCQWGIRYMGFGGGIKRFIFKALEKTVCKNSTYVECESFSLLDFSLKEKLYKREKAAVIWNGSACGVNLSKYRIDKKAEWREEIRTLLNVPGDAYVFGYAGRITKDKGVNELFGAFKKISEENEKAYLFMIGKFDNEGTVDEVLKSWALNSDRVKFVDWTGEIEKYYAAMDVFTSLSYREGFGLVVIEAAAMGLPGIVSNVPGQLDTIEDGTDGILAPVKDPVALAEIMQRCINEKQDLIKMGENARRHVEEKYDKDVLFEKLKESRDNLI